MRYLCLVYGEEARLQVLSDAENRKLIRDSLGYDKVLADKGQLVLAHALKSPATAKSVRVRSGRKMIFDGPFAETKEQLLGFILIEARDEAEAVEAASGIPLAAMGTIEVRQIHLLEGE